MSWRRPSPANLPFQPLTATAVAFLLPMASPSVSRLLPLLLLSALLSRPDGSAGAPVATEFVYPNFTASNLHYVDYAGVFLQSPAQTFQAVIASPRPQQPGNFYLSVVHVTTTTIVWSANRAAPVPDTGELHLSPAGLSLSFRDGYPAWSTPPLDGAVSAMRLLDTGNLLLLDRSNATLWQSFDHPTNILLSGQDLPVGAELVSATDYSNLTEGDYRLVVTAGDAVLQWKKGNLQYWSLSTDARAAKDSNAAVSFLAVNGTGLYLFGGSGGNQVTWRTTTLPAAALQIGKLDHQGRFTIRSYALPNSSVYIDEEFVAPSSGCDLPFPCLALGMCIPGQNTSCSCPPGFGTGAGGCLPSDGSTIASASVCTHSPSYLSLRSGIGYFANKFARAVITGGDLSSCRSLCSQNCSCLGFYYRNSSGSCFLLRTQLGSFSDGGSDDASSGLGFLKVVPGSPQPSSTNGSSATNILPIILPSISVFLLLVLLVTVFFWWRRRRRELRKSSRYAAKDIKLGRHKSWPSSRLDEEADDDEEISIPGLPRRFRYEELEVATDGFRTRVGSGGFGEVYKGVLPDNTTVAVKRISNIGVQGKREFCTEIAVIGNIHHVNLVKLRGFCVQGTKRLLVYEYMNKGSLDRSLFAGAARAPVLEWGERVEIALGTARGLAYLHSGCDHKIIHCDVKPENILLSSPSLVKISDFGLSKLLAPEQSAFFTTMRGTRGYLAPEWLTSSAISDRTDVYSYGMVLLEIVRGRKNCVVIGSSEDSELGMGTGASGRGSSSGSTTATPASRVYFPMHALEMHEQGRYLELADPRLGGRVEAAEVEKVVRVALCCLHEDPALRPSMAAVVGMLEGTVPAWSPRSESLNFLRFYGRGFQVRQDTVVMMTAPGGGDGDGGGAPAVGHGGFYGRGHNSASTTSAGSTTSASQSNVSAQQLSGPR